MSLILDALRKLEREKDSREPAVLVVGSVPWGGTSRTRHVALASGAALVVLLAVLLGWLLRRAPSLPPAAAPPVAASAVPVPVPPLDTQAIAPPIRPSRPLPSTADAGSASTRTAATAASEPPTAPPATSEPPADSNAGRPLPADSSAAEASEASTGASSGDLRLNAISKRDGRPVALINDRLVFEGDSFDDVRVLRIGEAEVEVEVRGQRRVLRF